MSQTNKLNVMVRGVEKDIDLPTLIRIEEECFQDGWGEKDFLESFNQPHHRLLLAEHGIEREIIGFAIYAIQSDGCQIINLAVAAAWQRRSIGSQIIKRAVMGVASHCKHEIKILVSETNVRAQLFLRSQRFRYIKTISYDKENGDEDVYIMFRDLHHEINPNFLPCNRLTTVWDGIS